MTAVPVSAACSICGHEQVAEIDAALHAGGSLAAVAGEFGVAKSSLGRHKKNHGTLQAVVEDVVDGASGRYRPVEVHAALTGLAGRLQGLLEVNLRRPDRATSLANIARELRQTLEAVARLQADPALLRASQLELLTADLDGWAMGLIVDFIDHAVDVVAASIEAPRPGQDPDREDGLAEALRASFAPWLDAHLAQATERVVIPGLPRVKPLTVPDEIGKWARAWSQSNRKSFDASVAAAVEVEVARRLAELAAPRALPAGREVLAIEAAGDEPQVSPSPAVVEDEPIVITRVPARATPLSAVVLEDPGRGRWSP